MSCPANTFLSGNNCIISIEGCQVYADCFSCTQCQTEYKLVDSEFNSLKVKTCADTTLYDEINVQEPNKNGVDGETYMIVDDYMRSLHS